MDFLNEAYGNAIDREILDCLYSTEGWLSASEIIDITTSKAVKKNPNYTDRSRNVRIRLKKLVEDNDVNQEIKEATGRRGRAPEIFALSETLRGKINDYLIVETKQEKIESVPIPVGDGLQLTGRVITTHKYSEVGDQKILVSIETAVAPSSEKPFLLSAILTADRLGHPIPSEEQIQKLKRECGL